MSVTRRTLLQGAAVLAALQLAGCAPRVGEDGIRMACGERGGTYLQFGELLDAAFSDRRPGGLTVLETEGSVENLELLRSGDAELAIVLADAAADDAREKVAIGRVYQNYLQCFTLADGHVRGVDDLRGRRVSVGAPRSGAALTAGRVFDALGLTEGPDPVQVEKLKLDDAVTALVSGELDAFVWSGGLPLPAVTEVRTESPVSLVDLTAALPALRDAHPGAYVAASVPPGAYGTPAAIPSIGISNYLLARADFPDDHATALVDVLIDDADRLVPTESLGVQFLTASNLVDTPPIALHPAARRRYRERYG
ncbi:hypothetical protein HNR16_000317 [Pseudoclavibacter chungangensis]|uniref:TAXI family TRAP transporter solute-binding subunit n=1 Tax=Pseudoclavibacter chungangensis TaxID=587635 RepID=UPI0015CD18E0|nr:TAXI family TRAP transporter solute-binding subunit [Pseudoclavibacter chungangensis]NYJ65529.1 hypothetical protein [Pseudoclavibacter chungangensis]